MRDQDVFRIVVHDAIHICIMARMTVMMIVIMVMMIMLDMLMVVMMMLMMDDG